MAERLVDVGTTKQLFIDDLVVGSVEGVQRQLHRPVRHAENPVLQADRPWEVGGNGIYGFGGTVFYDEEDSLFKMWYRTSGQELPVEVQSRNVFGASPSPSLREPEGTYKSCYAVSEDGVHWEKPDLGQFEFNGSTSNNILPPSKDGMEFVRRPNLIKDYDEPDPNRRYKMLYMDLVGERWGLSKGYSPDGIEWDMNVGRRAFFERPIITNGVLFGWDPNHERYVHLHSTFEYIPADVDGRTVRAQSSIMRSASRDFIDWGDTRAAITRDRDAPPRWDFGHVGVLAGVMYTMGLYVGFADTCFTHWVEDVPEELWTGTYNHEHGVHKTELVISRDGVEWTRAAPYWEFMRPGLWGTWDDVLVGLTTPLVYNDEVLVYYTGRDLPCASQTGTHPQRPLLEQVVDGVQQHGYAIGLAKMRLDGFASMDGYDSGATLTTAPLRFDGDRLQVNVRAPERGFGEESTGGQPHGQMRVEVLDDSGRAIEGFTGDDSDAFAGDELRHVAAWNGSPDLSRLAGSPVRLRFHLKNAALYSFQFVDDRPRPDVVNLLSPGARGRP